MDIADSFGKTAIDYSAEVSDTIIESLVRKLEGDLGHHALPSEGDLLLQMAENDRVEAIDNGQPQEGPMHIPFLGERKRSTSDGPARRRSSGGEMLAAAAAIVASAMAGRRELETSEVGGDKQCAGGGLVEDPQL